MKSLDGTRTYSYNVFIFNALEVNLIPNDLS